ncbi:serpin family protein [Leptothermofonsia sp. ETS-13]|uniref:serpin family protein n=1 Tax=Leptothermofonsia sp. ETS-13 TaxID=3035696 RepID=UPI003B9DCF70
MNYRGLRIMGGIGITGLVLLGLMGCIQAVSQEQTTPFSQPTPQTEHLAMQKSPEIDPQLVAANTQFGFKLFSEILKQDRNKNIFVSPSSVAIALAMTYNGASGETQKAMAKALELNGMSLQALNQANANLKELLQNPDPKVQLAIANSIWARQDVSFKPDFMQRNQTFYGAEIANLNFNDPKSKSIINGWVKDNTRGKIEEIIDSINPRDVLFLINAIYFKGDWTKPFDKKLTAEKPFYRPDGSSKQHPLMSQRGEFRYFETDRFQAVSLPYGEGQRMSMDILLPKKPYSASDFYQDLTAENWQQWVTRFRSRPGTVQIPRFKLEYDIELKRTLSALGMAVAFDGSRSDFSGISSTPTRINQVKHKTFVEVNEEGTEAAAVTSIGIRATSAIVDEPFSMVVDRPFFCTIRDNRSGTVVFMGAIVDPQ